MELVFHMVNTEGSAPLLELEESTAFLEENSDAYSCVQESEPLPLCSIAGIKWKHNVDNLAGIKWLECCFLFIYFLVYYIGPRRWKLEWANISNVTKFIHHLEERKIKKNRIKKWAPAAFAETKVNTAHLVYVARIRW